MGETPAEAVERCLREEMSPVVTLGAMEVLADSLVSWEEVVDSPSFPGLTTQYTLHQMTVVVPNVPDSSFITKEGPTKQHFWEWREDGPDSLIRAASGELAPAGSAASFSCWWRWSRG